METLAASGVTPDESGFVERYVLVDAYAWSTPIPGRVDRTEYHVARKGEVIRVSPEEAARGEALDGLSSDASEVEAAVAATTEPPSWDDMQLDSANVEETVAYLTQHPTEADRVLTSEQSRPERKLKTRKTIVEAAERIRTAYLEQLEADTDERERLEAEEQAAYEAARGTSTNPPRIPGPGS